MQDITQEFDPDLADLPKGEWLNKLAQASEDSGFFQPLGRRHFAAHVRRGDTLIVTFETVQGIRALSESGEPLGWSLVRAQGWSHLLLASDGDTWFRDSAIYGLFDSLIDHGFFDDFDTVLFYGAGPCGYAAAAYSVAHPGAKVLAIQPQATLDPRITEWDDRFTDMRRIDFSDRYGYAPDMLDACDHAYVIYDPAETLDAMHTALFTRPGVTKLRMRNMGDAIQSDMMDMDILLPILTEAATGTLSEASFAQHYRKRRENRNYLRRLLTAAELRERPDLAYCVCTNVVRRLPPSPKFQRRAKQLEKLLTFEEAEQDAQPL